MNSGRSGVYPLFFREANSGGSGGGSPASGASGGGQQQQGDENLLDIKLFDSLPWDDLDEDSKKALETIKTKAVATLQTASEFKKKFGDSDKLVRKFQSEADRLKIEAEKSTKKSTDDPYLSAINEELVGAGYSAEDANKLSPVFSNMFKRIGVIERGELGKHLAPMAQTVLAGQATDSYMLAQQNDPLGMLQIPEVAQTVWDLVRERVEKGTETSPDIILNLAKMAWADREAQERAGGKVENPPVGDHTRGGLSVAPPNMRTGGFSYPGSPSFTPIATRTPDANAAKHTLNEDTRQALATTFRTMTSGLSIVPKELKDVMAKTGRNR